MTVSALLSDAQVKLEQQKFTGRIDGVSLATEYMLSPDLYLKYEHLSGNGNLNETERDFNFNRNSFYVYREFVEDNFFFLNWRLNYKIGVGLYQKTSKLGMETYNETQFPVLLGVEMSNTSGIKIGLSGLGQLNNLNNDRSGSLSFAAPVINNLDIIGKYTNHSSKVNGVQHCGSDYFVGFSLQF